MKRLDDILGYKGLKIYQDSNFFSFSLDSIILANYATIRLRDKNIIDFCTGNGVVPLILSRRTNKTIYGIEIQDSVAALAKESVEYNQLDKQIHIICEDVKDFSSKHLNEFDLILCNPPYFKINEGSTFNDSYEKMIARHEISINLDDVFNCAKKILKDNGNICLVHRTDRFIEILDKLKMYGLEPKRIKFVHENIMKESTLFLVEAQKCGKVGLRVDKPLIQYDLDGNMTEEYDLLQKGVLK